ncbi:unnamed protein product [Acanthoscelides obtectus]|uniref:Uncharacterized protein n=1 Tax=Acanthoscelides obtectus TaxID=200917 RepID=A0A9P0PYN2_ACAOB|nr:unnamed protein product [Acanthoscelides obtectus]CAK1662427.1 hypothetical protein AOBTE_LOCUS23145 [Acanthoscelides obtectus]
MRLDKSGCYHTGVSQHLKASFEIAFMIGKQKKPHTIGKELIKHKSSLELMTLQQT